MKTLHHTTTRQLRHLLGYLLAILIAASTVLIHQHHVLDVVTGWLLAMLT